MILTFGGSVFDNESRTIFISHQLHFNLISTSLHFLKFIVRKGEKLGTRRNLYDIIRFGMVLVAADCSNSGIFYSIKDQVYEMVE